MVMSQQQFSSRHIARTLYRSASTITRELHRFSNWQGRAESSAESESEVVAPCSYDVRAPGSRARLVRFKPRRIFKLVPVTLLFGAVSHFLSMHWWPFQIAGTLKLMRPHDPQRTVSHETIYNCIYAMPKGELRKDLIACLRRAQNKRLL
jgi:transposase, IS30 family